LAELPLSSGEDDNTHPDARQLPTCMPHDANVLPRVTIAQRKQTNLLRKQARTDGYPTSRAVIIIIIIKLPN
jgi:hypothetical protein